MENGTLLRLIQDFYNAQIDDIKKKLGEISNCIESIRMQLEKISIQQAKNGIFTHQPPCVEIEKLAHSTECDTKELREILEKYIEAHAKNHVQWWHLVILMALIVFFFVPINQDFTSIFIKLLTVIKATL